ncbi:heterokaryon incompatibility protein-domain-containing protein [Hypoxylon sp. FL1284]|nr:heterokaryon incompatibility protein-domain-containing protein [Hypoxylon sp. FL1284]
MPLDSLIRTLRITPKFTFKSDSAPVQHVQKHSSEERKDSRLSAYPYRELSGTDVRLIRILPGDDGDVIKCHIDQIPLDSSPKYFALSYVWGDTSDMRTIKLNNHPFEVTQGLYEAMYQFRQLPDPDYTADYFWIDAICINQGDIEEKSREVPRMVDIYTSCTQVLIWLGPNGPPSKNGVRRLLRKTPVYKYMGSKAKHLENLYHPNKLTPDDIIEEFFKKKWLFWISIPEDSDDGDDDAVLRQAFGGSYHAMIRAWAEILTRPWFMRTWTIQEACIPADPIVYIGRHRMSFTEMSGFLRILGVQHRALLATGGIGRMLSLERIRDMRHAIFDLEDDLNPIRMKTAEVLCRLLSLTARKECSDPRDQIYGIIGLLDFLGHDIPPELLPDYHRPYEDLCWDCTVYIMGSIGDLRLLDCQWNSHRTVPSWVADFRFSPFRQFKLKCEPSVSLSPDKRTLCLQGLVIGAYEGHIPRCSLERVMPHPNHVPEALSARLQAFEQRIIEPSARMRGATVEETLDGFFRDGRRIYDKSGPEAWRRTFRGLSEPRRQGIGVARAAGRRVDTACYAEAHSIADEFRHSFVLLADGTVARLGRQDVRVAPGDLLCLFRGAQRANLVRPRGDDYTYLGQCDIRVGSFAGAAFDDDFWKDRETEEFRLV